MKRGQYSLEFLLTYAWAFFVIGLALATIYSFGWIRIDQILPEKCEFYGQTFCKDFQAYSFDSTNAVNVTLVNRFGADLRVVHAEIFDGINRQICGVDVIDDNPLRELDTTGTTPVAYVPWNNSADLLLHFDDCQIASAGTPTKKWVTGTRFEGTMNITFYNPATATGDGIIRHNQLGMLYVLIRED